MRPKALAILAACAGPAAPAAAAELSLALTGAAPAGKVWIQVFGEPGAFARRENPAAALILPPSAGAVLAGLPPGRYAVAAFQDVNGNGRLDTNLFGQPVEPHGFSRKAGSGDFAAAAIEIGGEVAQITVEPAMNGA
ncbi:MAG: DUF2141 domain-containing protein [Magnetospirillum sp.]|nr:DUF2141 domain-containing protein [Magnetospirillum sp.]